MMTFKRSEFQHFIGFVNLTIFQDYRCGWIQKIASGLKSVCSHWVCYESSLIVPCWLCC